jgi:hypothetical protein
MPMDDLPDLVQVAMGIAHGLVDDALLESHCPDGG